MTSAARQTILGSIRKRLREARLREPMAADEDVPSTPVPEVVAPLADLIDGFRRRLESVGGHVHRAADVAGAATALRAILDARGVKTVACSDDALVAAVWSETGTQYRSVDPADRDALLLADAGLSSAQWAVADTGSLVLVSDVERNRLVSLAPPLHVAVLPIDRMLPTIAAALARLMTSGSPPAAVTLITGPSRTADIELQLVIGVHGPSELHVVLVG